MDRRNVEDALPGAFRYEVYKTEQVLTGIPEAHAPAGAAFKVARAPAQVEGYHTLILIPDVHHAVMIMPKNRFSDAREQRFFWRFSVFIGRPIPPPIAGIPSVPYGNP
jgi:hypothetical protein